MNDLLLHDQTRRRTETFLKKPAHALLVSGPKGSGKRAIAEAVAGQLLDVDNLENYPYISFVEIPKDKTSIGIEAIRELDHFFSLKVPVDKPINRVVVIEDAETMTLEAQNALLKLLEEPPDHSLLILAAANEQALLPTIRSRTQGFSVTRPSPQITQQFFSQAGYGENDIKQAYAISGGLPGLMTALLADQEHPLKLATEWARKLLSQSSYERLLAVDELAKSKQLATDTTFILQQMAHVSLAKASGKAAQKWQNILQAGYDASEALAQSAQPKLVLTNLMLNL